MTDKDLVITPKILRLDTDLGWLVYFYNHADQVLELLIRNIYSFFFIFPFFLKPKGKVYVWDPQDGLTSPQGPDILRHVEEAAILH